MHLDIVENKQNLIHKKELRLSKKVRWLIVVVICAISASVNTSNPILSAAVNQIKKEYNMTTKMFGLVGTFSSFGCLMGSIIFSVLIKSWNNRYLIIATLILDIFSLVLIIVPFRNYYLLLFSRFIDGICTEMGLLYAPYWAERFAIRKWKSMIMGLVVPSFCFGDLIGYYINSVTDSLNWRFGLKVEISLASLIIVVLLILSNDYFGSNIFRIEEKGIELENINKNEEITQERDSLFNDISNENSKESNTDKKKNPSILDVFKNIPFITMIFFKANKYFISFSISYWYVEYLEQTLHCTDKTAIFYSYLFSFILSYMFSMTLGGVIQTAIGGYKGRTTIVVIFIVYLIAFLFSLGIPLSNSVLYFTVFCTITITLIAVAEIMSWTVALAVAPKEYSSFYVGIGDCVHLLSSLIPAPFVFGFLLSYFGDGKKTIFCIICYAIVGLFLLIIAFFNIQKK